MRRVIIESPFKGDLTRNQLYLRDCLRDAIFRGESPYASHAILPGPLDDTNPAERDLGIRAGYAWWSAADVVAFYVDHGWSEGMKKALHRAKTMQIKWEERRVYHENNSRETTRIAPRRP